MFKWKFSPQKYKQILRKAFECLKFNHIFISPFRVVGFSPFVFSFFLQVYISEIFI
jgi:hypothetical protein